MKCVCVFTVVAIFVGLASTSPFETYPPIHDNYDIEAVIADPIELELFAGCFIDRNDCGIVAGDFKRDLPEIFQTACAKCSDIQKHMLNRLQGAIKETRPQDYEAIKSKYDPNDIYTDALEVAIAGY